MTYRDETESLHRRLAELRAEEEAISQRLAAKQPLAPVVRPWWYILGAAFSLLLAIVGVLVHTRIGVIRPRPAFGSSEPQVPPVVGPFDRGAAAGALGAASATLGDCRAMTNEVVIDSGPFVGTPVADCVARHFAKATVPPFDGGPVSVGKTFTLQSQ